MPAVRSADVDRRQPPHAAVFYASENELETAVVEHLADTLAEEGVAVVLATPQHRARFEAALARAGLLAPALSEGRLVLLDAGEVLASLLVDGQVSPERFEEVVGGLIDSTVDEARRPVHLYGELVSLLWRAGELASVVELEALWDGLVEREGLLLLCGYQSRAIDADEASAALEKVLLLHSSLASGDLPRQVGRGVFPNRLDSPGRARHFVSDTLKRWKFPNVDDAILVTSELATNAVLHASSPFELEVAKLDDGVRISVQDRSPLGTSEVLESAPRHGLGIVAKVSRSWGVERTGAGKVVWAELAS